MALVAGIDSSTQTTKGVVVDADTGTVVREGRAPHPDGTECAPAAWWQAWEGASGGLLADVEAIAVGGQQHGMVLIDENSEVVRPALLWNDTRSAADADDLVAEFGGAAAWAEAVGSVPVASFTVTKLRWMARHEPESLARSHMVMLPHDWLTMRLRGVGAADAVTDRGDASGTGYWSPVSGGYRHDLLAHAAGGDVAVPRVVPPGDAVGHTPSGILVAPGTGDNMAAALGVGAAPGDVVISLGTSGTAFAVSDSPTTDSTGAVAGFADATGRYLPLVCTLNAARVLSATASLLGVTLEEFSDLALSADPGSGGLTLVPYLDGERTPNLPHATGSLHGITRDSLSPANLARAAVEGMLCGLADAVDALRSAGVRPRRFLLIGGAAGSPAVQVVAASLFGGEVVVPPPAEYVALGAARQAAWALRGTTEPPVWSALSGRIVAATAQPEVRARFAEVSAPTR